MSGISINVMLSIIERATDSKGKPVDFTIEFIKQDGTIRVMKGQKHVRFPGTTTGEKSNFKYNLKNRRTILLYDVDLQEYRTVKIESITRFNKQDVIH